MTSTTMPTASTTANETQHTYTQLHTATTATEVANAWLLPDGVHDVLFADADKQQHLRHYLIQQLQSKGYDFVTPPLIEFTESLLGNASEDLKRQTFKIIDQMTGRLMGIRADTTPQILRIDASHGANGQGEYGGVARYCYAGHTLHTLPTGLFGLRMPLQLGAEIFGSDSIQADYELLDILCDVIAGLKLRANTHLDLGHVGVFRRLSELANLSDDTIEQLMQLYANKALPELQQVCQTLSMGKDFYALAKYGNDLASLNQQLSKQASEDDLIRQSLDELQQVYQHLSKQNSHENANVSVDAADLLGYHYHSGLVFNLYLNGGSQPLVRGGRFDGSKTATGKTRPAIGFSMDVTRLLPYFDMPKPDLVLVDFADHQKANEAQKLSLMNKVNQLRAEGYRVVIPLSADDQPTRTSHRLQIEEDEWEVREVGYDD